MPKCVVHGTQCLKCIQEFGLEPRGSTRLEFQLYRHFTETDARLFAASAEHLGLWCRQIYPPAPMDRDCFICQSDWWVVFDRSYTGWQKSAEITMKSKLTIFRFFYEILKCLLYYIYPSFLYSCSRVILNEKKWRFFSVWLALMWGAGLH